MTKQIGKMFRQCCLSGIMLVVTGSPMSNATETSEVFDLEHPEYECDNLGNFPDKVSEAIGGLLGNRPVICSGMDTGNTKSSKCYTMGELGQPSATLQTGRWLAAGTLINETTMWITGGIGQDWDHLTSTEFVYSNHNTSMGPSLPQTRYSHCMLKVRSSVIAIIGGGNGATAYQETVWFYNFDREKFVNGSGLIQARMHHVCGLITDSLNRKPIMVVAAGRADGHQFLDTTELWADDSEKWVKGPDMPVKISGPSSMVSADGNHFIMVGGESLHYQELYEIYKLQCFNLNCEWEKMPHELNVARQESVAMLIPSNMTRCQPVG